MPRFSEAFVCKGTDWLGQECERSVAGLLFSRLWEGNDEIRQRKGLGASCSPRLSGHVHCYIQKRCHLTNGVYGTVEQVEPREF